MKPRGKPFQKGRVVTDEVRAAISRGKKGKKQTAAHREAIRQSLLGPKGPNWKGGKTEASKLFRNTRAYAIWREAVFKRDNWTCVWCLTRGGKLHADHIKPFAQFPELRLAIDNGRTLCEPCHRTTDTYGHKTKTYG